MSYGMIEGLDIDIGSVTLLYIFRHRLLHKITKTTKNEQMSVGGLFASFHPLNNINKRIPFGIFERGNNVLTQPSHDTLH